MIWNKINDGQNKWKDHVLAYTFIGCLTKNKLKDPPPPVIFISSWMKENTHLKELGKKMPNF